MDEFDFYSFFPNCKILCLSETWLTSTPKVTPSPLQEFKAFYSAGHKSKDRGRASGGLATFIDRKIEAVLLDSSLYWLIVKIEIDNFSAILINVYINRDTDIVVVLEMLEMSMLELRETHSEAELILVGDFNSRIGMLNQGILELFNDVNLEAERYNRDKKVDTRGRALAEFSENNGLFVLNGRSRGDAEGGLTYIGPNGSSTVDLALVGSGCLSMIYDFFVGDPPPVSRAYHIPIKIVLLVALSEPGQEHNRASPKQFIQELRWKDNLKKQYIEELSLQTQPSSDFMQELKLAATKVGMTRTLTVPRRTGPYRDQAWFDDLCREKKLKVKADYKQCKANNFQQQYIGKYLASKKEYKNTRKKAKKLFYAKNNELLACAHDSKSFWGAIKQFKAASGNQAKFKIDKDVYAGFLKGLHLPRSNSNIEFQNRSVPSLDSDFRREELEHVLGKSRQGKASGPDQLSNEFFKCLPPQWVNKLLETYNSVLETTEIPPEWAIMEMFTLYKKGDHLDPNNHRGIFLINCVLKFLTQLISERVHAWAEETALFYEGQNGFRKGRGCIDGIFTLTSIIHIHIQRSRKIYTAFVDFKQAFDLVDQDLLWSKLYQVGLSSRLIAVLRSLYSQAGVRVRGDGCRSELVGITKGVLQGDSLSPLLFSLFINDLAEYMSERGAKGMSINQDVGPTVLLYADDLVLLGHNRIELQRMLNFLHDYCRVNKLTVNCTKTKVVVFRAGGRLRRNDVFSFDGKRLEIVNQYTYLGIPFSSKAVFRAAADSAVQKAGCAGASLRGVLARAKCSSWEATLRTYDAMVTSVILYGTEVWALRYSDSLERAQCRFFKYMLNLPRCTPNYMVRNEAGVDHLESAILNRMLRWWQKILKMDSNRFPRLCYNKLKQMLDTHPSADRKYNWVSQIKDSLCSLGYESIWELQDPNQIAKNIPGIIEKVKMKNRNTDQQRINNSSYNERYKSIQSGTCTKLSLPILRTRIFCQLRTTKNDIISLYIHGCKYSWNQEELCSVCNSREKETLYHFLVTCPHYRPIRSSYLGNYLQNINEENFHIKLLNGENRELVNKIFYYTINALKIRAFLRNE